MPDTSEILVATIAKNSREEFRLRLAEYHGKHYADLRVFIGEDADTRGPTKKGVAIGLAKIDEVIAALGRAKTEAIRLGYLASNGGAGTS